MHSEAGNLIPLVDNRAKRLFTPGYARILWLLLTNALVSLSRDPEALFPRAPRRNHLEIFIDALLTQVEGVRDGGHGLKGDEAFGGGRRRACCHGFGRGRGPDSLRSIDRIGT